MTEPQSAGASQPTPQQLNRITAQLRDLNEAYKAAVAANGKGSGESASNAKPSK